MEQHASNLWSIRRPLRLVVGDVGCRMTVVRLADGTLWLHSPVEIDEAAARALDGLGPVRWIIVPSLVHHMFVAAARARYPEARVLATPGLAEKRRELAIDEVLTDAGPPGWRDEIDQHVVQGMPLMNEVAFCHRPSRTLVLTDLAFNVPRDRTRGARLFYWLIGAAGRFGPHRIVRLGIRDRAAARRSLDVVLGWDFDRVIVSHGEVLGNGGRELLARAFAFLGPSPIAAAAATV